MPSLTLLRRPFLGASLCASLFAVQAAAQTTERVSVSSAGAQANDLSFIGFSPYICGDGSRVVFSSYATNFVGGVPGNSVNAYMRDRATGQTSLLSRNTSGAPSFGYADGPTISSDGAVVAFASTGEDLVVNDHNVRKDVFLRDLATGAITLVSTSAAGVQGNGDSFAPSLSADGRFVAFTSTASNLVPGDTNGTHDVFVRDMLLGTVTRVSVDAAGVQGNSYSAAPALTGDGRFVAFNSDASNFPGPDAGDTWDVFVKDLTTGTLTRVSVDSAGAPGDGDSYDPSISADGRWIAFQSEATNLVAGDHNFASDVFLRDVQSGTTTRISRGWNGVEAAGASALAAITPDARFIAFTSGAPNIVPGDTNGRTDVFVFDRPLGVAQLVSIASSGAQGDSVTSWPSISSDGRFVGTESWTTNLVPGDTNGFSDIFVHERTCDIATYCTAKMNSSGCTAPIATSGSPKLSGADNFHVTASLVVPHRVGVLGWSTAPTAVPFHGGVLCVQPPFARTLGQDSGGSTGCTGQLDFHFSHAYMAQHALVAGDVVYAQFVYRDPNSYPFPISSTDAVAFEICP